MRVLGLGAAAGLAALVACSVVNSPDDPQPAAGEGTGAGTAEGCPEGFESCSGACVNTAIDPQNCGACSNGCSDSEVCGVSQCLSECPEGTTDCDGSCVDLMSEVSHCGECGNACTVAGNQTPSCSAGACAVACDSGFDDCDGDPINGCEQAIMADDINHCGSCGNICVAEQHATAVCNAGSCGLGVCDMDWDDCDGDPENGCEGDLLGTTHCGMCDHTCPGGGIADCDLGSCRIPYSGSFTNLANRSAGVCNSWNTFRGALGGVSFTSVTMRGSQDTTGRSCTDPAIATQICQGLSTGSLATVSCDSNNWLVGSCLGGVELSAGPTLCFCTNPNPGFTVRPCVGDVDWGGVGTPTCDPLNVSQTMEVICVVD